MEKTTQVAAAYFSQQKWMTWTGRVVSLLPIFFMLSGIATAIFNRQMAVAGMAKFGYSADKLSLVLALELTAVVLYLIPPTAVFGAIFMTAYFGGAVATHVRVTDPGWPFAVLCAICVWIGLWLREPRLRPLAPIRRRP
jgi:hypothetical protein